MTGVVRSSGVAIALSLVALAAACIPPPADPAPTTSTSTTSTSTTTTAPPAHPDPWRLEVIDGRFAVGEFEVDLATSGLTLEGTVDDGEVVVPTEGFTMSPVEILDGDVMLSIRLEPTVPVTGTVDSSTGEVTLDLDLRLRLRTLTGVDTLGPNCGFGSAGDPIRARLTTGMSGPLIGIPFDPTVGVAGLVDATFVVPPAYGCGLLTSYVSEAFDLPSASGQNSFELLGSMVTDGGD